MRYLLSLVQYLLSGVVAVLFTLYIIFRPKNYELVFELAGLLLVLGIMAASVVGNLRRLASWRASYSMYFRVVAGPLLLGAAVFWAVLANRLHISFVPTVAVFLMLLGSGAAMLDYSIHAWFTRRN